jgi:hypothetical protein
VWAQVRGAQVPTGTSLRVAGRGRVIKSDVKPLMVRGVAMQHEPHNVCLQVAMVPSKAGHSDQHCTTAGARARILAYQEQQQRFCAAAG